MGTHALTPTTPVSSVLTHHNYTHLSIQSQESMSMQSKNKKKTYIRFSAGLRYFSAIKSLGSGIGTAHVELYMCNGTHMTCGGIDILCGRGRQSYLKRSSTHYGPHSSVPRKTQPWLHRQHPFSSIISPVPTAAPYLLYVAPKKHTAVIEPDK